MLPLLLLRGPLPVSCLQVAADAPLTATVHRQDGEAWRSFQQLLDARRGSRVAGLAELKRYLARFGYMPRAEHEATDAFDAHMEAAVRRYQTTLGLPVTGQLDSATLDRIMAPRCGVGDHGHGVTSVSLSRSQAGGGVVSRFTFFKGEPRWTQPDPLVLTYAISATATVDYLPAETVRSVFRRAFARWARVIPVGFVETDDYDAADVRVGFYMGSHGDGIPFDGPLGVLGHAFSPKNGRLHLDAAERWAVDMGTETAHSAVDLESVATHEIGHVLGLGHSSSPKAVMYPSLSPREKKADLTVDDIEGVQWLYGPNPGFSLSSLYQQDTSMAPRSSWLAGSASLVCAVLIILVTQL
ncbi:Metalloendoproteinase 1-MMP [Dichanthelium oligosanthes]|uniref:Metalloendoproteinase 1-MMP n=1 Tax=Dichanthelium oligosanthes TaxID=888268 RepID=A0A1E5UY80_9POAL|nr:Metalloendoproteinase 1-MMP [Dichanthelium oligosanthes]